MSYCVECGVELDKTARSCPLCHTEVSHPKRPPDTTSPTPFPLRRAEVEPVSKKELALLLSAMFLSVAVLCGVLNLFFLRAGQGWSLYVIGAAAMLWVWLVPPLLRKTMPLWTRLGLDVCAVALYIYLISINLHGEDWFWAIALPIVALGGILVVALGFFLSNGRSILSSVILMIGAIGLFILGIEYLVDVGMDGVYRPGWSLIVATVCIALAVPLLVVRFRPALRDEVRRRFHM